MTAPYRRCSCGHVYATREHLEREAKFIGVQHLDGYAPPLALRNCATCQTTFADPIPYVLDARVGREEAAA